MPSLNAGSVSEHVRLRRGLISLEARESPSRAWNVHASPGPAKPSRLSASFSPSSSPSRSPRPHVSDIDLPVFGRRLSSALDASTTCSGGFSVQAVPEQTDARQPVVGSDLVPPEQGGMSCLFLCCSYCSSIRLSSNVHLYSP